MNKISKLKFHLSYPLPTMYEDTLSYLELLKRMGAKIDEVIDYVGEIDIEALMKRLKELFVNCTYDEESETLILSFDEEQTDPVLTDKLIKYIAVQNLKYPVADNEARNDIGALDARVTALEQGGTGSGKWHNYHSVGWDMAEQDNFTVHYRAYVGKATPTSEVSDDFEVSDAEHCFATFERALEEWDRHTSNMYIAVYGNMENGEYIPTTYHCNRGTFAGGQLHLLFHSPDITLEWGDNEHSYDHLIYNMYLHIAAEDGCTAKVKIKNSGSSPKSFYLEGCAITAKNIQIEDASTSGAFCIGHNKCQLGISNMIYKMPFYIHNSVSMIGKDNIFAPVNGLSSRVAALTVSDGGLVRFDSDAKSTHPITVTLPTNKGNLTTAILLQDTDAYFEGTYFSLSGLASTDIKLQATRTTMHLRETDKLNLDNLTGTYSIADSWINGQTCRTTDQLICGATVATNVAEDQEIGRPLASIIFVTVTDPLGNRTYRFPLFIGGGQTGDYYASFPAFSTSMTTGAQFNFRYKLTRTKLTFLAIQYGSTVININRISIP